MCEPCSAFNVSTTGFLDSEYLGTNPGIDSLISQELEEKGIPGAAVGVVRDNEVWYLNGYGLARLGNPGAPPPQAAAPWTVATPSSVGSISKTITALGVLRLSDRGMLDLDDHVLNYVSSVAAPFPYGNLQWLSPTMTIRGLLGHTTGLPHEPVFSHPSTDEQLQAVFPSAGEHPGAHPRYAYWSYETTPLAGFDPGDSASYSNVGYALLGAVIDNLSQSLPPYERGYERFIWWNVGSRAGMRTLCLNAHWKQGTITNLAFDYPRDDENFVGQAYTGWEGPPGGWTMTIGDLARLMGAINTNQVINSATRDQMMTPMGTWAGSTLGLGVLLHERNGRPLFLHGGLIGHYEARYVMWPDEGVGVAIMANAQGFNLRDVCYEIGESVIDGGSIAGGAARRILFTEDDCERASSATYRLVARFKRDLMRLVRASAAEDDDFESALRNAASRVFGDDATRIIRSLQVGKHEEAATLALPHLERLGHPLTGPGATLPDEAAALRT